MRYLLWARLCSKLALTPHTHKHMHHTCTHTHTYIHGTSRWLHSKESVCSGGDQVQSLGREDPLEEGTATLSSILAWRIPWTEVLGGLQSTGSQRVGHNLVTEQ